MFVVVAVVVVVVVVVVRGVVDVVVVVDYSPGDRHYLGELFCMESSLTEYKLTHFSSPVVKQSNFCGL